MAELRVKSTGTLKLFESDNTSSVTIASPASLGADRTVTLPDGDVTLVAGTMSTGLTGWSTDSGTNDSLVPASASAGIYLGVAAATASNLLDDYEFGTFTPSMASTGGSFTTVGTCSGYYTKVGKMVQVQMELSLTTVGSGSGNINVTNMPFTSAATGLVHTLMMCRETQTAGVVYDVIMSRDVTACVILAPSMSNGSGYSINGMYRVA